MATENWEDVGGDMYELENIYEEATEICEDRDENCFGCPIAKKCPF